MNETKISLIFCTANARLNPNIIKCPTHQSTVKKTRWQKKQYFKKNIQKKLHQSLHSASTKSQ